MHKFLPDILTWISTFSQQLSKFDDIGTILDRILLEARTLSSADAGTVFIVENNELVFAYTHNDTLFPVDLAYKYSYALARLPIDPHSIAGYCATYGNMLNLADVRQLPSDMPFSFNENFDNVTGYKTVSVFCLPLIGKHGNTLGVIQLINSMQDGKIVPFPDEVATILGVLAVQAVNAVERSLMAKEMIYRMQLMAALSDPQETAPHVERVGAIAAELYQVIAEKNNIDIDTRRVTRSQIRLAAMLHDLGKVAIPHEILKKPSKLTAEEFAIMQTHCAAGSKLFPHASELIDCMAKEIARHHHQKWNGHGYTGDRDVPLLAGEDIPLPARITAVADVFDALTSARCYKAAWKWEDAVAFIKNNAGSHFDPQVVEAFLTVEETIKAIYARYQG
ncbi:MAG: HD domain-containing protein [Desulfovibrionaceae bacterium]